MNKRNIIVIGTSAGGVHALCELNQHLPKDLDASVFVVVHIGTATMLPHILTRCGNLLAVPARHEEHYKRGCIYCAPAHCHLAIKDQMTILMRGPRENGHRPAVDVLFRSAARVHRSNVIGVVLSGGLDDGSAGLYAIKVRGGVAIVQDPGEATTRNMPESALKMVDVDFCLPVRQIAGVLVQLVNGEATNVTQSPNGGVNMEDQATADHPSSEPPAIKSRSPARSAMGRCMSSRTASSRSSNVSLGIDSRQKASVKDMPKHSNAHSGRRSAN